MNVIRWPVFPVYVMAVVWMTLAMGARVVGRRKSRR